MEKIMEGGVRKKIKMQEDEDEEKRIIIKDIMDKDEMKEEWMEENVSEEIYNEFKNERN